MIAGRSVKWLHSIEVSDKESQHYVRIISQHTNQVRLPVSSFISGYVPQWLNDYILFDSVQDNKVLPTQVTAEEARSVKSWWYDPK
jgi:nitrate reductase (NAD(P)H)